MATTEVNYFSGGGGGLDNPTTLWTNANPSSNMSNGTISDVSDMSGYEYIGFQYKTYTSATGKVIVYMTYEDFKKCVASQAYAPIASINATNSAGNSACCRRLYYVSDTSISYNNAQNIGSSSYDNTLCILTEILGYK